MKQLQSSLLTTQISLMVSWFGHVCRSILSGYKWLALALLLTSTIVITHFGCAKQKVCDAPLPIMHSAFHEHSVDVPPIRRVVVLPVENRSGVSEDVLKSIQNSLAASLREQGIYEVVEIPHHLRPVCPYEWIRRGVFPEPLLADLFRKYSADGVIFVSVNGYSAYAPIALAATVHVVDTHEGIIVSSVDGNWSVSNPIVEKRMLKRIECDSSPYSPRIMMQSPRFLTDFVTSEIACELGNR